MSVLMQFSAAPEIDALVRTLSAPERLQFESCLKRVNYWMGQGAPEGSWYELRPIMGILVNYLMRIPTLTLAQMEALIVLSDEIPRRAPDLHLMHFVWTARS